MNPIHPTTFILTLTLFNCVRMHTFDYDDLAKTFMRFVEDDKRNIPANFFLAGPEFETLNVFTRLNCYFVMIFQRSWLGVTTKFRCSINIVRVCTFYCPWIIVIYAKVQESVSGTQTIAEKNLFAES